ncbi:TonB-dependent siderophore receptor [Xylophilus rhododendri]|uniref:TonB-dependent siderophore receptor n=1 Tax=Xylophilus rhododendri TaxID=2697032 RepID=A0A857J8G3_9BURK|nr:TonB-dependent receptor [Xylophilus rhododendri]QHJ00341.1 TonB-dependent siderophore receptor [Xylophilus rhododendri]
MGDGAAALSDVFRAAVVLPALFLAVAAGGLHAQDRPSFHVPPGPLNTAIGSFAAQSGALVSADGALTAGKASPGVEGETDVARGFERLLAGTGLQALRAADGSYVLRPAPPAAAATPLVTAGWSLPTVQVQASAEPDAAARLASGQRIAPGAQAQPQTGFTLDRHALDLLQANDLQQALSHVPGITSSNVDNSRYRIHSRGFQIDTLQFDGVSTAVGYLTPPNLSMYESVEVLRGPDGVMAGVGSAGGTMNLVRKRPQRAFEATARVGAGSYQARTGQIDIGGPLDAAGQLRGRIVASTDRQALRQQGTWRHDDQLYGVLETDLGPSTELRIGASRQWLDSRSMQYGYPTYTDGSFLRIPYATYYGADWNRETYRLDTAFAELLHRLDAGWSLKASLNQLHSQRDSAFAGLRGAVVAGQDLSRYQTSTIQTEDRQTVLDLKAAGPLQAWGRSHDLTLGLNASHQRDPQSSAPGVPRYFDVSLADPYSPPQADFSTNVSRQVTQTDQLGAYAHGRFALADRLDLAAGLRASRWTSRVAIDPLANASGMQDHHDGFGPRLTPSAGLVWRLDAARQLYASTSAIYTPQTQRDASGTLLKPLQGRQEEAGLRQQLAEGRLQLQLALFRLVQANRAMNTPGDTTGTVFQAQGKARTQGLDAQLSGHLQPGWELSLGYTRTLTRYLDSSADTGRAAFMAYTPGHLLKAWTDWRPAGQRWHVGGALKASSAYQVVDGSATIRQRGFATLDTWIGLNLRPGLELRAHLENAFDRLYYQSLSSTADHNFLGNPRLLMLTLQARY